MPVKHWLGIDAVDLVIHIGVTLCLFGIVGVTDGPDGLFPVITLGSILALALRRKAAMRRGLSDPRQESERLAEVEDRLHYLEGLQDRVVELEERLDFTERMLTKQQRERLPGQAVE
jgi:hypothetical protein